VQRVWLKALDAENVRKAFAAIEDNRKYHPLRDAAEARSQADWLVGMNITRVLTIRSRELYAVGRVQTPTLALVVRRDLAIENFVPRDYFEVFARCRHGQGVFTAKWEPRSTDSAGFDEEGRLIDRKVAEAIGAKAAGQGKVAKFEARELKQPAPLPFSLSALQKVASARHGMSANRVLEVAQSLYEKKITSYPRTDCQYLPEEQHKDAPKILASLPIPDDIRSLVDPRRKHAAWNNAKITAHNAIVPTGQMASGLSGDEARLFELIWKSYVALFLPDYRYRSLSATVDLGGEVWKATGRQDIDPGWKRLSGGKDPDQEDGDAEPPLPTMRPGDAIVGEQGEVKAKQTKPPARFTDGSLIEAMSHIHKFVEDPEARAKLKETSGIGTEATRAATIEALFERDYLTRKGKQILSTPKGRALVAYLERPKGEGGLPELLDPVMTARWEDYLSSIAEGKLPQGKFLSAIEQFVRKGVSMLSTGGALAGASGKARETAPCPICGEGATVTRSESKKRKGVYFWACSNREAHPLLADDHGKPGQPFGAAERKDYPKGPDCPHCAGTATQVRETSKGTPYFRCPSCSAAFWPDRDDPSKLGTQWEARPDASRSSGKPAGRGSGGRSGSGRKPGKSGTQGRK